MTTETKLSPFVKAYLECALFTGTDESNDRGGEPLDRNYDLSDIAPESVAKAIQECEAFQKENAHLLDVCGLEEEWQGRDFCLTRNHHGIGFLDLGTEVGDLLLEAAHAAGERSPYVGDDGLIHVHG